MKTEFITQTPGKNFPINNIEFQKMIQNDLGNKWYADQLPEGILGIEFVEKTIETLSLYNDGDLDPVFPDDVEFVASFNVSLKTDRLLRIEILNSKGFYNGISALYGDTRPLQICYVFSGESPTGGSAITYKGSSIPCRENQKVGGWAAFLTEWQWIATGGDYQIDVGFGFSEYPTKVYSSSREPTIVVLRDLGDISGKVETL